MDVTGTISGKATSGPARRPTRRVGEILCQVYAGAWRSAPSSLVLTGDDILPIMPRLLDLDGAGLVWPRLSSQTQGLRAASMALEYGYERQVVENANAPGRIAGVVSLLREAGIEPILFKGWSVARLYPPPLVRLTGDIDLLVCPDEFELARVTLKAHPARGQVDLHHDAMWVDLPRADVREFTEVIDIDGTPVRVLVPELQLHVLCHHFMRHACLRPLWLCDIALLLESRAADFDWELCLGDNRRRRGWVLTAIGLAHHLLGAEIDDTPVAAEARRLPRWLIPAVLSRWEMGERPPPAVFTDLESRGLLGMVARRWPEPIGATVYMRAPFNGFPRLPIQLAAFLNRIVVYGVRHLPRHASSYIRRRHGHQRA
jgi:hypothetical protein